MDDQGALFPADELPAYVDADSDERLSIGERFELFDAANPWVYGELRRLGLQLVGQGHDRIGISMLFEVLRWKVMRATQDPTSRFKLNNDYRSLYSRKLMELEPALAGVFETRRLAAERE